MMNEQAEFSFGVFADVQYCDHPPFKQRYYRQALHKLKDCIQTFQKRELAFVIQLGDLIDRDYKSFEAVNPVISGLNKPFYSLLGNHDFEVRPEYKSKVLSKLGLQKGYYHFQHQHFRLIVLDGNEVSCYAYPKESDAYSQALEELKSLQAQHLQNAQAWNGGISKTQLDWLEDVLQSAKQQDEKVIIFCHFPIWPESKYNLWNHRELNNLLQQYPNIVAYLNGHNHAGDYAKQGHIHFLTMHGVVETQEQSAYGIVHVYQNRLEIEGFGREPQRTLYF
ncbi:metallophosphoesterase [Rapidithrix thailandica]|uniref:Metallophosphoesterase n=1 Tax=Rapidithrix thailandica TaxID=413964 RepID=A0AAW9SGI3_9BACT